MKLTWNKHIGDETTVSPGKYFKLEDGKLIGSHNPARVRFHSERIDVSLAELAQRIETATAGEHITSGVSTHPVAVAIPQGAMNAALRSGVKTDKNGLPLVVFNNTHYTHLAGERGALEIDSDYLADGVSVIVKLERAVPGIGKCGRIECSSTGAYIYDDAGTQLKGLSGQHTLMEVEDASDLPRTIVVMQKRLILVGEMEDKIGADGSFHVRSAVDQIMKIPSQPLYLKAHLGPGLKQRKSVKLFDGGVLDTRKLVPDLTPEESIRYAEIVATRMRETADECKRKRVAHHEKLSAAYAEKTGVGIEVARADVARLLVGGELGPDMRVRLADGREVSVRDILMMPEQFHGMRCTDPIEPDYRGGDLAGTIYTNFQPMINSYAHGGRKFYFVDTDTPVGMNWDERLTESVDETVAAADADIGRARRAGAGAALRGVTKLQMPMGDTRTVDDLCVEIVCRHLKIEGTPDTLPVKWDLVAGAGLYVDLGNGPALMELSAAALHAVLKKWYSSDVDECIRRWAPIMVVCGRLMDMDDPKASALLKSVVTVTKLPKDRVEDTLQRAIEANRIAERALANEGRERAERTPEEEEAAVTAAGLAEEARLLARCVDIARNPVGALEEALSDLNIAGERENATFVFLIMASSALNKPANGLIRGASSTGKSWTMNNVARLFPEEAFYRLSSMSSKAIIYERGGFEHRTIILEEAEALVRSKAEDKNDVAEMLRVLLSEQSLHHSVVVKDIESGRFVTEHIHVQGPTNLVTSTTRKTLDPEIMTRLIDRWSDTTQAHMQQVMGVLGKVHAGEAGKEPDFDKWHSFIRWMRLGPKVAVVPFAGLVAAHFPITAGSRAYRDLNNLMSLTKAAALVNRYARQLDSEGRLLAEVDDYAIAYGVLGERIDELSGEGVPLDVMQLFAGINRLLTASGAKKSNITFDDDDCYEFTAKAKDLAGVLKTGNHSVRSALERLVTNNLITYYHTGQTRSVKYTISVPEGLRLTDSQIAKLERGEPLKNSAATPLITPETLRELLDGENGPVVLRRAK